MIERTDIKRSSRVPFLEMLEPRLLLDAVRLPWVAGVLASSVYVSLEATDTSTATVDYGLTSSYGSQATTEYTESTGSSYVHNVKLTSLQAGTLYHYKVTQGSYVSPDYTFYAAPQAGASVQHWGFAADCRTQANIHNSMAANIDSHDPDMMVYGGDLCYGATYSYWDTEWFVANQETLNTVTPWVNAAGNHEGWNSLTQAFTQSPAGDDAYFTFDYGDAHIVVVNTEISYSQGSAQWNWVDADLANTDKTWKIVAFHKSAYVAGGHGNDAGMVAMTTQIFEPRGVDMCLTGHSHFYQHNEVNGIVHMVLGSFGAPLVDPGSASWTVYSEKIYNFGIFDVTASSLTLKTYRQNNTLIETIELFKDPTPPTVPTGLTAEGLNESQIWLEWNASSDPESGVDHYNIYRNSEKVGQTTQTCYLDENLDPSISYTYEVTAVNGDNQESDKSSPVQESTTGDVTAPKIEANWSVQSTEVEVMFTEDVEQTSAENINNYSIDNGVSISSATLQADGQTVKLITSTLSELTTYTLTINNVQDLNGNPIAAGSQSTFEYDPWSNQDIGSCSPAGSMSYTDGTYTIQSNGHDIYDTYDDFHYVYNTIDGDGEIIARVVNDTGLWAAKSGVMFRKSLDTSSTEVSMVVGSQVDEAWYQRRYTTAGSTSYTSAYSVVEPEYVRLVRANGQFAGYISEDGETWNQVGGWETIGDMASGTIYLGLAATSHATGTLGTFYQDNVKVVEYGANTAPTAVADDYQTSIGGHLNVAPATGVLINDTDPENDDLNAVLVTDVSNGTLALYSNGAFGYTPNPVFTGQDTFQYKANDGRADGNTATVTIDVQDVPQPPVANDDSYETDKDTQLVVPAPGVLANDTDPNEDPLTAEKVSDPSHGSVNLGSDGSFTYDPTPGYSGPDSFTYKAWDGQFYSNVATVNIDVQAPAEKQYAVSEETITGTKSGSYLDTMASDNVYEALTEALVGKKSILEHNWTFTVTAGDPVTFSVEAYHDGTEDDFLFQYSTNGSDWNDMVTVTKTADDDAAQTFGLPGGTSGTVYVKVLDTNRANNKKDLDTVYVDELFISSYGGPPLPVVTVVATDSSAAEEGLDTGTYAISRTGSTEEALTVSYAMNGTAVNGTDYDPLSGTAVIGIGQSSTDVVLTPVDDLDPEGSETAIMTISTDPAYTVGSPGSDTVTVLDNDISETKDYALSESTAEGTVSGSYLDTYVSDDVYESITEVVTNPTGRASLDHTWTFDVTGGSTVEFYVEAWHSTGGDDDFVFQYSTDGVIWYDMVTVTKTADDDTAQSYELDPSVSGTVYVKVIDTVYNKSESLDTIYVDEMYILSS